MRTNDTITLKSDVLYAEMEKSFREVSSDEYYHPDENKNIFQRITTAIAGAVSCIVSNNRDIHIFYYEHGNNIVYINTDECDNDGECKIHRINKFGADNVLDNAVNLLDSSNTKSIIEACYDYGGFVTPSDNIIKDLFKYSYVTISEVVPKLFEEYFNDYKKICGSITGFSFRMDCANKRKFNRDNINYCIELKLD